MEDRNLLQLSNVIHVWIIFGICDILDFSCFSRHWAVHSYVSFNFHDGHFPESRISFEQSIVVSVNLSSVSLPLSICELFNIMNIWQRTVYLSNTFLLWLSIDYKIGKCKQYWFAHLFYLYNYFTYCKIVSFLLFTGLTRFRHRLTYCVQCHIGCDNKLTVYIRLVS